MKSPSKKCLLPTYERVRHLLNYDPETGVLSWRVRPPNNVKRVGDKAGGVNSIGYECVRIDQVLCLSHRVIWLWYYGYWPENNIDHINRTRNDNRIVNLREESQSCNAKNSEQRVGNRGVKGVYERRDYKGWTASIKENYISTNLGSFKEFTEAVAHRLAAEQCLGWEGCDSLTPAAKYMRDYLCKTSE